MQTARPRAGARISASVHTLSTLTHLLSLTTQHYVGETTDNKQTVDEEMMGVAWLLALQAFLRSTPLWHAAHTHATPMMKAAPMMPTMATTLASEGRRKRRQGDTFLYGMWRCASGCRYAWGLPRPPTTGPPRRFGLAFTTACGGVGAPPGWRGRLRRWQRTASAHWRYA